MATMADLDRLALAMPHTTKEISDGGRPSYSVHGKLFCCHRGRRRDAIDSQSGERLDDVLMFRVADQGVKELLLADARDVFFTTPHFDGYPAVLVQLEKIGLEDLREVIVDAWLARAPKRLAQSYIDSSLQ
jgi:hypothetical protein